MNKEQIRELTNIIYKTLFGKNTLELLIYFKLPLQCMEDEDDDDLRDCMGLQALQALQQIEHNCWTEWQTLREEYTMEQAKMVVQALAMDVAVEAKAAAAGLGVDLLTGMGVN